jgi:two-component system cell cycle sensor histidine kinase/response regulator CckA
MRTTPASDGAARLRVLLVEDEPGDAFLTTERLTDSPADFVVDHAPTLREAVAILAGGGVDAILCDLNLPDSRGLATVTSLRVVAGAAPILVLSGSVDEALERQAIAAGAEDVFSKDQATTRLFSRAVLYVIQRNRAREQQQQIERLLEATRAGEEQLRQAQKMEAVGRLAGGVAHDFNNALSIILTYAQLLATQLREDEPMRRDVAEIVRSAEQAARLTRQLLMFSRRQVLQVRSLDLNETLTTMHRMLERLIGEDVELSTVTARDLDRVRADPGSIEQVIMNLVINARDAMPNGGKLTLESANVELEAHHPDRREGVVPGRYVRLSVSDTGIGMDQATRDRVFEPFFTTKEVGRGTGLGLATVFGIAQQSGGCVLVQSEPGRGTTFKVYLPAVSASAPLEPPPPPSPSPPSLRAGPPASRGRETILLVEDDDQLRDVERLVLARSGYRVLAARDAAEALAICADRSQAIHLLLTDVVLPQMSGPVLAQKVTAARPEVRVLCMSGHTNDSVVRHGILTADIAFLQKPVTPDTLAGKVREVLDGERPRKTSTRD